jgi:cytochrome b561
MRSTPGPLSRWRNSGSGYGWISILLHWGSLPLVLFLLGSGIYMVTLTYYDPLYHPLPQWHKEAGVVLTVLTVLRFLNLLIDAEPALLPMPAWQRHVARAVHGALYLCLALLIVSGYAMTTAEGQPIDFMGVLDIPAVSTWSATTVEWLGVAHRWVAYGMGGMIALHAAAALHHHFRLRDSTLRRMLFPPR